jgi:hypothetical protein
MGKKNRKKKQEASASPKKSLKPLIVKIGIARYINRCFFSYNNCDNEKMICNITNLKKKVAAFTDSAKIRP